MIKQCLICNKDFITYQSIINIGKGKYCSKECCFKAQAGRPNGRKGIKLTEKQKSRMNMEGLKLGIGWNKGKKTGVHHDKQFKKGQIPWNKGMVGFGKGHEPHYIAYSTDNRAWKGEDVGYGALHDWVRLNLGKPSTCEICGIVETGKKIHWANKSHEYKREVTDWIRLCAKCHKAYDKGRSDINNLFPR